MEKLQAKLRDAERDAADAADETEAKSVSEYSCGSSMVLFD